MDSRHALLAVEPECEKIKDVRVVVALDMQDHVQCVMEEVNYHGTKHSY